MAIIRKGQPGITRILPHWQNRRFAVPEAIGPITALLSGDSWTNWAQDEYPNYLPTGARISWNNEGIAATPLATVSGGSSLQSRIASELSTHSPDVTAICSSGINDIAAGTTAAQLLTAVQAIQGSIESANSKAVWVGVPIVSTWTASQISEALTHNYNLAEYCADNGIPFVPLVGLIGDETEIFTRYQYDVSHLNAAGCKVLAGAVMGAIKATKYRRAGAV